MVGPKVLLCPHCAYVSTGPVAVAYSTVCDRLQKACQLLNSSHLMRSCRVGVQRLVGLPGDVFRQRVERAHRQVNYAVEVPLQM